MTVNQLETNARFVGFLLVRSADARTDKKDTVQTMLSPPDLMASRMFLSVGVHSTTTILPLLSASRILQLEAIAKSISKEIALSVLTAFSTISHNYRDCNLSRSNPTYRLRIH